MITIKYAPNVTNELQIRQKFYKGWENRRYLLSTIVPGFGAVKAKNWLLPCFRRSWSNKFFLKEKLFCRVKTIESHRSNDCLAFPRAKQYFSTQKIQNPNWTEPVSVLPNGMNKHTVYLPQCDVNKSVFFVSSLHPSLCSFSLPLLLFVCFRSVYVNFFF